jgi:acyl-lipid omega-6 desaturase (Delta-12 desaturase)
MINASGTAFLKPYSDKSTMRAILLFAATLLVYGAAIRLSFAPSLLPALAGGILAGFPLGQMFIVGHDCAHHSYFASRRWNQILGRISFLFPLHAFGPWVVMHNRHHHGCVNLKGEDDVWPPMSPDDYATARPFRRWLERFYRGSPFGNGAFYMTEIWFKSVFLPINPKVRQQWRRHLPDTLLVVLAVPVQMGVLYLAGTAVTPELSLGRIVLVSWVLPFLTWNFIMGVTTFLQHTHPRIRWYDNRTDWSIQTASLEDTARVSYPAAINWVFYDSNEHAAHHVRPAIPVYNLRAAQRALEARFADRMVVVPNAFREYLGILRICKLYDYTRHQWCDFAGRPTTAPAVERVREAG